MVEAADLSPAQYGFESLQRHMVREHTEWEYRIAWLLGGKSEEELLLSLGKLGWELIAVLGTPGNNAKGYFKRKLID
jgi:hypothetical protein